eukprot:4670631-Alexandrium_andersonii.AAC.1
MCIRDRGGPCGGPVESLEVSGTLLPSSVEPFRALRSPSEISGAVQKSSKLCGGSPVPARMLRTSRGALLSPPELSSSTLYGALG